MTNETRNDRLFSPQFLILAVFSFLTFFMGFLVYPIMPLRILSFGGTESQAGLFLGIDTLFSALSAPIGGAIVDRLGRRFILIAGSGAFVLLSLVICFSTTLWVLLPLAALFGTTWSALMAASFAAWTAVIPASRRAEGLGYSGIAGTLAVAAAPTVGLLLYDLGWLWLCAGIVLCTLALLGLALGIHDRDHHHPKGRSLEGVLGKGFFEWRIFLVAITMMLYTFGHGGITSFVAIYAKDSGTRPAGVFFMAFAASMALFRPLAGRLADRLGPPRVLVPCLVLIVCGQGLLAFSGSLPVMVLAGLIIGTGHGSAFPVFSAMILGTIPHHRRGAAFGSMLLAFDAGMGAGSVGCGWLIQHHSYGLAYGISSLLSAASIPYFLFARRFLQAHPGTSVTPQA